MKLIPLSSHPRFLPLVTLGILLVNCLSLNGEVKSWIEANDNEPPGDFAMGGDKPDGFGPLRWHAAQFAAVTAGRGSGFFFGNTNIGLTAAHCVFLKDSSSRLFFCPVANIDVTPSCTVNPGNPLGLASNPRAFVSSQRLAHHLYPPMKATHIYLTASNEEALGWKNDDLDDGPPDVLGALQFPELNGRNLG